MKDASGGPALVFLHFFGGSARSWDRVIEGLGRQFVTLAPDLAGFGAAADAAGPFTLAAYADQVERSVRQHAIGNYVLVGHSMGGKIALALAARRPPNLQALILVAPSPPTPEPIDEELRKKLIAGWGCYGPASETFARTTRRSLEGAQRERIIADMMGAGLGAWTAWLRHGSREDISPDMARIEVPAIILSGDGDAALPTSLIEREVTSRLPRAHLIKVAGAGHLLPMEAPEAVAAAVLQGIAATSVCEV